MLLCRPNPFTHPVALSQNLVTAEDTALPLTLQSDPGVDPLVPRIVTFPAHGALTGTIPVVLESGDRLTRAELDR